MRKVERHEVPDFAHVVAVCAVVGIAAAFLAGISSGDIMKAEARPMPEEDEDGFAMPVRTFKPAPQFSTTALARRG